MTPEADIRVRLSRVAALERRRRLRRLAWGGVALLAGLGAAAVVWEAWGPLEGRAWGYGGLVVLGFAGLVWGARAWRRTSVAVVEVAGAVERAFPQARGVVRDALESPGGGLGAARVEVGRAWLARRGVGRLDAAVGEAERARLARWRRGAVVALAVGVVAALARPAAARRALEAVADPASLWRDGTWSVEPGNAVVEAGGTVEGRARFVGSGRGNALVLQWRSAGGAWRAETLAERPEGVWRWTGLDESRAYRLRYGAAVSDVWTIAVAAPFAVVEARARSRDGAWEPLSGRILAAGDPIELEGRANGTVDAVEVRIDGRRVATLTPRGRAFGGTVTLPAGIGRLAVTGAGGETAEIGPFVVAGAGRAYVIVVAPGAEIAALRGSSAWIEARAGAPAGLASLTWETDDGRTGTLADPAGARDTTVAAVVPLGAGRAPGDTVAWRIAAVPFEGAAAATPWRRAVLPDEGTLRRDAAAERTAAERAVERALETAERAARGSETAAEADRALRSAADSLARAIDRTLADPGLGPEMARELAAQRSLLDRAASDLEPRAGLPAEPESAAEARAAILEAVRDRLEALERALAQSAAADSLERLADRQRDLAGATRDADPEALEREVAPRQGAIDEAARDALAEAAGAENGPGAGDEPGESPRASDPESGAEPAGARSEVDRAAERAEAALDAAAEALRSGAPRQAAEAQERAAGGMESAAGAAREEAARRAAGTAAGRAALDRAGAEALFLADRQRAVADDAARGERRDLAARQEVVTGGLERTLRAMVDGLGGVPAGARTADAIGRAVHATMYARRATRDEAIDPAARATAAADAADALASLARELLLPGGLSAATGQTGQPGAEGRQGAAARELQSLADAQRALADALGAADEPAGGNPRAARAQRQIAERLERVRRALEESGADPAALEALARSAEESAARLERGLAGARSPSELRALERRMRDLGRMLDRSREERRSESARPFVPADPGPLPPRAGARRLDAAGELEAWRADLPAEALAPARRYLEALEEAGVRATAGDAGSLEAEGDAGSREAEGDGSREAP